MSRLPDVGRPEPPKPATKPEPFDLEKYLAEKAEDEQRKRAVDFARWKRSNMKETR